MADYINEFEKQEVLQNLKVKARNLNIWRYGMVIAAILLYTDMKTSRIVPSGIALGDCYGTGGCICCIPLYLGRCAALPLLRQQAGYIQKGFLSCAKPLS